MPLELQEFNLSEERLEFRDTLRRFFEESSPITEVRRVMEGDATGFAPNLWKVASEELGLAGIAISEDFGGQGFGLKELSIALGEVGRSLAPIPLFASAALAGRVVAAVGGDDAGAFLRSIAEGEAATLAWVEAHGDWDPAAVRMEIAEQGDEIRLTGEKQFVVGAHAARRFFVIAREPGSHCDEGMGLFAVEANAEGVAIDAKESFDLTQPLATLRLGGALAKRIGRQGEAAPGIRVGLDEATALLTAEMVGGMQKVLETAVDYAAERHQFSRPIGSFQAIKHKCADLLIDFEGSRTAADAAVMASEEGDPERSLLASVAKSHVGPAGLRMATESGQIQGGVGYTWEYDAHLYYRRAMASAAMLGDETMHQERLARLVASRRFEGAAQS